jgi:hypothetical protein
MRILDLCPILVEAPETADKLFRKIEGLDNMINDRAATDGEKDNARRLKTNLEQKLKDNFPDYKPSRIVQQTPFDRDDIFNMYADWFAGFSRAMEKEDRYDAARKDPSLDRTWIKNEILKLKKARKQEAAESAWGNVEARQAVKDIDYRINKLLKEFFPEEYAAKQAKNAKSADAAYDRRAKQSKEKVAAKVASKDGKSWREAIKEYPEAFKEWSDIVKNSKIYNYVIKGTSLMSIMASGQYGLKASQLRELFSKMSTKGQQELKAAVESTHTKGYINEKEASFTEAQKENVIKAMTPKFDPNNLLKGESTWKEFIIEFTSLFDKAKYKRTKWDKDKNIIEILSANVNNWYTDEYKSAIHKGLTTEERTKAIEALEKVGPKNSTENAKIRRLLNLLK